ncbi:MAG: acetaldehyde dehydrogenase (acetylating) [Gammaproteobacteria bacterium]
MTKTKTAILGSGKIACDLLVKLLRSKHLSCDLFAGQSKGSEGIAYAAALNVPVSFNSIQSVLDSKESYEIIFDATSASAHEHHQKLLAGSGISIVNLTPAITGKKCIPSIDMNHIGKGDTVNMVSCGGQASLPIIHSIRSSVNNVKYIEVVSSIAAKSAGAATRSNINEYLENTENAILEFSECQNVKTILNVNPAEPCVDMQVTIYMLVDSYSREDVLGSIYNMVSKVQQYVPFYRLVCEPIFENEKIIVIIGVKGAGDYLPAYAGNLDIITSASIMVAEHLSTYPKGN